ncbi:MAG: class I SAM-dependent methyltransferase [Acidimicrobiales bacterium]
MPTDRPATTDTTLPDRGLPSGADPARRPAVAEALSPLIVQFLGEHAPVRFVFWDGSDIGPHAPGGPEVPAVVRVRSVDAVRHILWAPGELGLARAFVSGDIDVDGDIVAALKAMTVSSVRDRARFDLRRLPPVWRGARQVGALRRPPPPPLEEARPRGRRHSPARDAQAVRHHYDVGNAFYEIVLGPSMTYSCARFAERGTTLEEAQWAKHELICRKLGLHTAPGARLLDVGCGWGSMALHAARHHGATVVAVTLSEAQADYARKRVAEAGLADRIEVRMQDYRDLRGERFEAISSVGMFEHVGASQMDRYFSTLHALLTPEGRLLNHAISSVGGSAVSGRSFVGRYVFPDGELQDVGSVVLAMERAGFEVRDVESLREHYARTLRAWVANLENRWAEAVELVGVRRARVWRLYMAASAVGFDDGGIGIHQVLGVVPTAAGTSGMPPTRHGWTF